MQGRLLPKLNGRFQAHPLGYWDKEFPIAAELGLDCIEFIFDHNDYILNPLYSRKGLDQIQHSIDTTGVFVSSICADYFMEAPLHHSDQKVVENSQLVMINLLKNASMLDIKDIVIPCVDQSSLKGDGSTERFIDNIQILIEEAEKQNVNLSLETDLGPKDFYELLSELPSSRVTVNYDTGNSASFGFNIIEEFEAYGSRISDIHIKDRKLNGGSVELGSGDTDFDNFLIALNKISYKAPFIMQVYRDDEGVEIFKKQLKYFKEKLLQN
ncbi:sugar phosphate isomerase/epimerase [Daejeonella sp.]|uniref:sugar phosphate isomerase/epimerase family protein n=1 Tax=Daejeonella sp. TaxID=2805397 RepID=UPI0027347E96|nr:sugar phosphate isomerase/epimerase family protein [Daejeonella sp.]